MERKLAMNATFSPNKGLVATCRLEDYDKLADSARLKQMIDSIRQGQEELKKDLPFRAAHYSAFLENRRTQKNAVPESFLFQTTVDVDKAELVESCMKKALELDQDEQSLWKGMLLHMEKSARGKLHIDIRLPLGMTIGEAQQAYCQALGISDEYDEACISPERIIYITDRRQEIFRSPLWYAVLPEEELQKRRKAYVERGLTVDGRDPLGRVLKPKPKEAVQAPEPAAGRCESMEEALPSSLLAFDLCVKEAGLNQDDMDLFGHHDWHTNLMAVLSVGLPKLICRAQLEAVVRVRLPNYSATADCQQVIDYFYSHYEADRGFMSSTLRGINAQMQQRANPGTEEPVEGENMTDDESDMKELVKGWTPPSLPKKLPRLLELLTANYDPRFREMLLLTALPTLSAHASHFKAVYLSGKLTPCQQFVALVGGSGSGKANATDLFFSMVKHTLEKHDENEWKLVEENAELRDRKANDADRPAKYKPKLRIFETVSKTSILAMQSNLGPNSMLLGQFSEIDSLVGSTRSAYSDISVLLRKGWDGDVHRQYYMSESSCNTYAHMAISLLLSGTVNSVLRNFFNSANTENGLMQRFIPVILNNTNRTFRPPRINYLNEEEKMERDALLLELYQKDLELGDGVKVLDLPLTNKAIGEWFDSLEERYADGMLTDAEADLSHRCGEFMLRAAIPLVALYGKETPEIVNFARWVGETAHYNLCFIFGKRVQQNLQSSQEMLAESQDARKTVEPILSKLPEVFTLKELKAVREREGQSADVKMLVSRYCRNGKLERVGKGVYRKKGNKVTVTKMGDPDEPKLFNND